MRLMYPWLLLLLLLVPVLVWARFARAFQPRVLFSDASLFPRLPTSWAVRLHPLLPLLYGAALCLLIIAIARPQKGNDETRVDTPVVDIALVVDTSTSMQALDMSSTTRERNRLDAAKEVVQQFIKARKDDRMAIIAFAAYPLTLAPLTLHHDWLQERLDQVEIGSVKRDGTAIGSAIASAVSRLKESEAKTKLVVLLTDGINNAGDISPENAAQVAKTLGIRLYVVGAGADGPVRVPGRDFFGRAAYQTAEIPINDEALQKLADITGGRYFRAQNFDELRKVYEEIDSLERTEVSVRQFRLYEERFMPFALAGLFCLLGERLLSAGRLGRAVA